MNLLVVYPLKWAIWNHLNHCGLVSLYFIFQMFLLDSLTNVISPPNKKLWHKRIKVYQELYHPNLERWNPCVFSHSVCFSPYIFFEGGYRFCHMYLKFFYALLLFTPTSNEGNNSIHGSIPPSLGNLSALQTLDIGKISNLLCFMYICYFSWKPQFRL